MTAQSEDVCRVCEGTSSLRNLFEEHNEVLLFKLTICADVLVEMDDKLPKYICITCKKRLENAYEFKFQCECTDRKLRRLISKNGNNQNRTQPTSGSIEIKVELNEELVDLVEDLSEQNIEVSHPENASSPEPVEEYLVQEFDGVDDIIVEENIEHEERDENNENYENDGMSVDGEVEQPDDIESDENVNYLVEESDLEEDNSHSHQSEKDENGFVEFEQITETYSLENYKDDETKLKTLRRTKQSTEKSFSCNTCSEIFTSFSDLNAHKKTHGDKRFQCPICLKWFSKHYRMKGHMQIHEDQREFPCTLCDKKYTNPGNLDRHIRHFHNKERPYSCPECGLSFSRSNILQQHLAVHSQERNFDCDLCSKKFKTKYYLDVHKRSHIPVELRKKKRKPAKRLIEICVCPYCGKKSNNTTAHQNHLRTHTGEKPFECSICKNKFTFQQSLRTHMLMHTGERPYRCDVCGVSFRQIGHLKGHRLTHSGIKPHKCQYCNKAFALRGNLNVHLRLHTGEKPYRCSVCNKNFYDWNGLRRHKMTHDQNIYIASQEEDIKAENNVSMDPLNVYLDDLGNEYTEIIESEIPMESSA